MTVIDLSHKIEENMPVFPGTEKPILHNACTLEKNGFREKRLTMYSHTGTHMDAPAHMIEGPCLDDYPPDQFIGSVAVIDSEGYEVGLQHLLQFEKAIQEADFVFLRTSWDQYWGTEDYFSGFPAISKEAAEYLSRSNLKGYGVDAISVDHMENHDFTVHHILLKEGLVLIENLCSLALVKTGDLLCLLPLKINDADGSPIRAAAMRI